MRCARAQNAQQDDVRDAHTPRPAAAECRAFICVVCAPHSSTNCAFYAEACILLCTHTQYTCNIMCARLKSELFFIRLESAQVPHAMVVALARGCCKRECSSCARITAPQTPRTRPRFKRRAQVYQCVYCAVRCASARPFAARARLVIIISAMCAMS